jgi:hypothetical protein
MAAISARSFVHTVFAAVICACGGHNTSTAPGLPALAAASPDAARLPSPPLRSADVSARVHNSSVRKPVATVLPKVSGVRISDEETQAFRNVALTRSGNAVKLVNGARIRVDIANSESGAPVAVMAGSAALTVQRNADGSFSASGRYVDIANPPTLNPVISVRFLRGGSNIEEHFPVTILHQ